MGDRVVLSSRFRNSIEMEKIGEGIEWELAGNGGNELKSVFDGLVVLHMRSQSVRTCYRQRITAASQGPLDSCVGRDPPIVRSDSGTFYPDPTKRPQRVVERTFRKNSNTNTRHEAQVAMPFYLGSSIGLTQIPDPFLVTSMGTRTEMFPPKSKPSTRRIFIPDQHGRVFIVAAPASMWLRSCQSPLQSQRAAST
jgi:hypothetical protein